MSTDQKQNVPLQTLYAEREEIEKNKAMCIANVQACNGALQIIDKLIALALQGPAKNPSTGKEPDEPRP